MNADMKWLDNPEVFRVNQLEAHSDHCYYLDYSDMKKEKNPLFQSLNGQWEFSYSKNVKSRPVNFYEETFDASGFHPSPSARHTPSRPPSRGHHCESSYQLTEG